jgi:hypothetical protein
MILALPPGSKKIAPFGAKKWPHSVSPIEMGRANRLKD